MNETYSDFRDPVTRDLLVREGDVLVGPSGRYPIVDGIPRFVPAENYAADFGLQWNKFPKTQLDSHTGIPTSEERLVRCVGGDLSVLRGKRVLEAGSGAGRFTEVLLNAGAILSSFDFSSAVEANKHNNGASPDLTLAQGDIRAIPFELASFDYVICLGVVQHTPSPEEAIASLWSMVKPGGTLVIDHYRFRWRFLLPTPVGDAGSVYRWFILRMPAKKRFDMVQKLTDFWFPVHWRWRDSYLMQRVVRRLSPLRFYYPDLPLRDREMHYEWSLLDTHDSTTDYYKHLRSPKQLTDTLTKLGATEIVAGIGGNGVEARARKPE